MVDRRHQTARQHVLATLRAEILDSVHEPGSRLRQEEVAVRLGVSTTPVREAFRDLLAEGLIALDAHRGALVRGLTLVDVREIYAMRIALEPLLAVQAVRHATGASLAPAEALHRELCGERDTRRWAALNVRFHNALASAAPEGRLARAVASLAEAAGAYVMLSMRLSPELMALNNADHAELLRCYRAADEEGARTRTRSHLEQTLWAIEHDVVERGVPARRASA